MILSVKQTDYSTNGIDIVLSYFVQILLDIIYYEYYINAHINVQLFRY